MGELTGWLLGIDKLTSVDKVDLGLAAPWAQDNQFWLLLGFVGLFAISLTFYRRFQDAGSLRTRTILGLVRGTLLGLLFLTLAGPVLRLTLTSVQPPVIFLVFDGTDSMAIEDEWLDEQRTELDRAVGRDGQTNSPASPALRSRADYLRALISRNDNNVFDQLQQHSGGRLEAFIFDGHTTSQLRRLDGEIVAGQLPHVRWAEQLTTTGQVSALGAALEDIRQQSGTAHLAGVILFSDFAQNAGAAPLGEGNYSPARGLGVPIYTIGCGAVETRDLAVELQADVKMKKAERTSIVAKVRQTGLGGRTAALKVAARRLGATTNEVKVIGETELPLNSAVETAEFPFTPQESGLFEFTVAAELMTGESVAENNRALRQVNVIDDYLRLLYVAYEPEWEWRFVKEVFYRDKLVGMDGFRTYLGSSDPRVRESNPLFVETLTPKRSDFFAHDVLFLGDMPQSSLTGRFGEMVREYVSELGGGLVVLTGPRFGLKELLGTPLAEMLPVVIDADGRLRDDRPYRLKRTAQASLYPFMKLGDSAAENEIAWNNLSELPWYQPVAALHEQAVVLAEHPTDKCADGKTPQPLIAIRQFGKGEVVYLGFNEIWRLRRKYGEQYYRQFWSQLIYRLGMSHALGSAKRFVPRLDRSVYRVEDLVTVSVEAYDENYEVLRDADLTGGGLSAELILPAADEAEPSRVPMTIPLLRTGLFEMRFPVYSPGTYSIRIHDPVTDQDEERRFEVLDTSAERRRVVRDLRLQESLAQETGGKSYDLAEVNDLPKEVHFEPFIEQQTRNRPLWNTPLWFLVVIGLMLGEWLTRKSISLQ